MAYNLTLMTNKTANFSSYFIQANNFTNDWFGNLFLLTWFIIIFVSLKQFGNKEAAAAATGLTTVIALYARSAQLVSDTALFMTIALMAIVIVYIYLKKP